MYFALICEWFLFYYMEGKKLKNKLKKESKRIDLQVKVSRAGKTDEEKKQTENIEQIKKEEISYALPAKVDRDKITLMWGGAIFFMFVIFVCWLGIFKDHFSGLTSLPGKSDFNFEKINQAAEEFNSNLGSTTQQIAIFLENEKKAASSTEVIANLPFSNSAISSTTLDQNDINKIKEEIIKLENNNDER